MLNLVVECDKNQSGNSNFADFVNFSDISGFGVWGPRVSDWDLFLEIITVGGHRRLGNSAFGEFLGQAFPFGAFERVEFLGFQPGNSIVRGIYYPGGQALPAEGDGSTPGGSGRLRSLVGEAAKRRTVPAG